LYGLYLSAAGLQAQERKQEVITNNLANANVNGFKRDLAVVRARANATYEDPTMRQYRVPVLENQGGGVLLQGGGVDLSQAPLQKSSNPKDLALDGRGFFVLKGDADNKPILTRDGSFVINKDGFLVQGSSNRPVISTNGEPIALNSALPFTVDEAGKVSQGEAASVQLKLVDVTDPRHLVKLGENVMTVDDEKAIKPASPTTMVRQGSLELSGVNPMIEMVNMMAGQRVFDANAKLISLQDTTLQQLNTIGRLA
jgi:flagellar basal-body rod protein FlgF